MSLDKNLQTIADVLNFYAQGWGSDPMGPGETTLFGTEYDQGKRAAAAIENLNQLQRSIDRQKQELDRLRQEKQQQATVIHGIENQVFVKTWLATQRIPLFGQAWAGYLQQGRGMVSVMHRWDSTTLAFQMESRYWSLEQIKTFQMPEEFLEAIEEYDPQQQAVVVFSGQDLSARGKRHALSLERNYFQVEVIAVEPGETVAGLAQQVGVRQQGLGEGAIDVAE